jgi:hypothetical protein
LCTTTTKHHVGRVRVLEVGLRVQVGLHDLLRAAVEEGARSAGTLPRLSLIRVGRQWLVVGPIFLLLLAHELALVLLVRVLWCQMPDDHKWEQDSLFSGVS